MSINEGRAPHGGGTRTLLRVLSPSDDSGKLGGRVGNDLCSIQPLAVVRPQTGQSAGLLAPEETKAMGDVSVFGGVGRPPAEESERRTQQFWALVMAGFDFDVAAKRARVREERALRLLSTPEGRQIVAHLERARARAAA